MALAQAIEAWEPVSAIRVSRTWYPIVSALHIVGLGILIGAILTADLRVLGVWKPEGWRDAVAAATPVSAFGLLVTLVTGTLLIAVRASHYLQNTMLLLKFGLIGLGLLNVAVFHHWLRRSSNERPALRLRLAAFVSVVVWIGTIFAGRWIAFVA